MNQTEFDFSDEETTAPNRIPLTFVGTTSQQLDLAPSEFRGMTVPAITDEIKAILRGIAPNVDFFEQDIVLAAEALAE